MLAAARKICRTINAYAAAKKPQVIHKRLLIRKSQNPQARLRSLPEATSQAEAVVTTMAGHWTQFRSFEITSKGTLRKIGDWAGAGIGCKNSPIPVQRSKGGETDENPVLSRACMDGKECLHARQKVCEFAALCNGRFSTPAPLTVEVKAKRENRWARPFCALIATPWHRLFVTLNDRVILSVLS